MPTINNVYPQRIQSGSNISNVPTVSDVALQRRLPSSGVPAATATTRASLHRRARFADSLRRVARKSVRALGRRRVMAGLAIGVSGVALGIANLIDRRSSSNAVAQLVEDSGVRVSPDNHDTDLQNRQLERDVMMSWTDGDTSELASSIRRLLSELSRDHTVKAFDDERNDRVLLDFLARLVDLLDIVALRADVDVCHLCDLITVRAVAGDLELDDIRILRPRSKDFAKFHRLSMKRTAGLVNMINLLSTDNSI